MKKLTEIIALPDKQELFIIREFDAPRELVFKAHTDPILYAQWLGPHGYTMVIDKFEPINGGSYRYIHKDKKGHQFSFHGVFHEVLAPELMIGTFEFEGLSEAGHVEFDTAKFEELPNNRTRLTTQAIYQSVADRNNMISSGMEKGIIEGYERLDLLLDEIKN